MKYNLAQPFFIKGGAIKMDAINKWGDKSYLKNRFKNSIVKVIQFDSEENMEICITSKKEIKFNDYIEKLNKGQYLVESIKNINVHPDIYKDLYNPDLNGPVQENPKNIKIFIGKDTKTGCHIHGTEDWVLHQIVGKKIVYLLPYEELKINSLFNFKRFNFSKSNFFKLDKSKYNITRLELHPGDVLYIPPWIWHATENIGYSIAVTKVFDRDIDYLKLKKFKEIKHRVYVSRFIETIQKLIKKITFN
jgi:hypothetical protein